MIEKIMNIQVTFAQVLIIELIILFLIMAGIVNIIGYIVRKIIAIRRKRAEEEYSEEIRRRGRELLQSADIGTIENFETVIPDPDQTGE